MGLCQHDDRQGTRAELTVWGYRRLRFLRVRGQREASSLNRNLLRRRFAVMLRISRDVTEVIVNTYEDCNTDEKRPVGSKTLVGFRQRVCELTNVALIGNAR